MNQTTQMQPVNRLYKSRIFAMLYSDRKDLLDLYNAVISSRKPRVTVNICKEGFFWDS